MKIKKLNRKEESDLRDIWKNRCSENVISVLQTIKKYCSKIVRKISEAYLGLCQTAIAELFCENSKRLKDINYFYKKSFIIGV